jgi:hypothetical protein
MTPSAPNGAEADEQSPLLGNGHRDEAEPSPRQPPPPEGFNRGALLYVGLCVALVMVMEAGLFMQSIPINQVLEDIICRQKLGMTPGKSGLPGNDNDPRCGSDPDVQGELALLRGWQYTFDIIPGE